MDEEQVQVEEVQMEEEIVRWSFDDFRQQLNELIYRARMHDLKIDEVLAAIDITAKNIQIQYEMAVIESINEERRMMFAAQQEQQGE